MEKFLMELRERKLAMEEAIFTHPPSNWEEFNNRLGRWSELCTLISFIEGKTQEAET